MSVSQKRSKFLGSWFLVTVFLVANVFSNVFAATSVIEVSTYAVFNQTEARSMLSMVNKFRQSGEGWYWNEINSAKIATGVLDTLVYDYTLEQIAMQRAIEIAAYWDHTRSNGEKFSTIYVDGWRSEGENLIIGTNLGVEGAFVGWQEEDEDYSGQGHRRAMLCDDWVSVGIAHATVNGIDCWVQEFSTTPTGASETVPVDGICMFDIPIKSDIALVKHCAYFNGKFISQEKISQDSFSAVAGNTYDLPQIIPSMLTTEAASFSRGVPLQANSEIWTSSDPNIIEVSEGKLIAKSAGRVNLHAVVQDDYCGISEFDVTFNVTSTATPKIRFSYYGGAYNPDGSELNLTIMDNGVVVPASDIISLKYNNNKGPVGTIATVSVMIAAWPSYIFSMEFEIVEKDLRDSGISVSLGQNRYTYTGSEICPQPVVTYGSRVLEEGVDYTVSYLNNTVIGTGTVKIVGIGNYTGTVRTYFEIEAEPIPTVTPTSIPTSTPTTEPTEEPTPTVEPTEEPTPTDEPTVEPTDEPTPIITTVPMNTPVVISVTTISEQQRSELVTAFVTRLYEAVLLIEPDSIGLNVWTENLTNGNSAGQIAYSFIFSNEVINRNLSNDEFVQLLYRVMYGREASSSDVSYWVSYIERTSISRENLFSIFADSYEWINYCYQMGVDSGSSRAPIVDGVTDNLTAYINSVYEIALGRSATRSEINSWLVEVVNHRGSNSAMVSNLLSSSEYISLNKTNEEFLTDLYLICLCREPDSINLSLWTNYLDNGTMTRDILISSFINSSEFSSTCSSIGINV